MARTSRKAQIKDIQPEKDLTVRAALYIRLSVEDKHTRTISIETQTLILERFLEKHPDIFVYDKYIDNGATGTNFHRPAFQQMLSDIEAGYINCVIVKDLSRLGRNTIDTGYYIEQYFPIRKVRFIAVTDQYDSADPNDIHAGIILPLKNMINEAYALDIGRKIKAQQRQSMKDGEYVGGRTPYGYIKAKDNCHLLIVDPVAASVVKQMFEWAAEGDGINTIVRKLNESGVISPSYYKKEIGQITHENLLGNGKWQTRTVTKILRCETYIGDLVQGHSKTVDHQQMKADADNLITVCDTHEAIISHELFDRVQALLDAAAEASRNRAVDPYTMNPLKGKVFCAHCGTNLHRQRNKRKKSDDVYFYHCLTNSRIAKGACPGVTIREDQLMHALTGILEKEMEATLGQYSILLLDEAERRRKRDKLSVQASEYQQAAAQYRSRIRGLYENLISGVITSDEYFEFKTQYESKIAGLEQDMERTERELSDMERQLQKQADLSRDFSAVRNNPKLTAELIDRLVERIEIDHDKHLSIRFRFQSEFPVDKEAASTCVNM